MALKTIWDEEMWEKTKWEEKNVRIKFIRVKCERVNKLVKNVRAKKGTATNVRVKLWE